MPCGKSAGHSVFEDLFAVFSFSSIKNRADNSCADRQRQRDTGHEIYPDAGLRRLCILAGRTLFFRCHDIFRFACRRFEFDKY